MSDLDVIARAQRGVVSRTQALVSGLSPEAIRMHLRSGRWQRLAAGTYATFTGEVPRAAQRWAALLSAGTGAVLSHRSAAEEIGLVPEGSGPVHVTVPARRRPAWVSGIVVHRSRLIEVRRHPTRLPPQTRVEETVLDLATSTGSLDDVMGWIASACGRRLTTPDRIARALHVRSRVPRRTELRELLGDVAAGCHSVLEWRYLHDVERAQGLPPGARQHSRRRPGGRYYDDVRYVTQGVRVELDGRAAHPDERRTRDRQRDNAVVESGERILRYTWSDVAEHPCRTAAQVAAVLGVEVIATCCAGTPASVGPHPEERTGVPPRGIQWEA